MTQPARLAARTALVALLLGSTAATQTWVSLDGSPAGTPAEISMATASNQVDTIVDLHVHGYWTDAVAPGDGNIYRQIRVPGLGRIGQLGAPDLPVARLRLAVTTDTNVVVLQSATDLSPNSTPPQLVHPYGVQATDEAFDPSFDPGPGFPDGTAEVFTKDNAIYGGVLPFPASAATPIAPVTPWMGSVPMADVEIFPASWDPVSEVLQISEHMQVHFRAVGAPLAFPEMTRDRAALAEHTFVNWSHQSPFLPVDDDGFGGEYAVLAPQAWLHTLGPFLQARMLDGFDVTFIPLESLSSTGCDDVKLALADWYAANDPWHDHYALLVGDASDLAVCPTPLPGSVRSDDAYGSPADGDLDEEIFIGRLSVDGEADLARQLDKVLAYEADTTGDAYDRALLVAHGEGAPDGYEAVAQQVASTPYADAPAFQTILGSAVLSDNAAVEAAIEAGVGVLAYRGHGSEASWHDWNLSGDWHNNAVLDIDGGNPMVVWSLSCWNGDITHKGGGSSVDSLGEVWMEDAGSPAVAHYGMSDIGETPQNDELTRRLFEAVYDRGLNRHGMAIAWAEQQAAATEPGPNAWMGSLLGDPAMRIRTSDARELVFELPDSVDVVVGGSGAYTVRVTDDQGTGVEGVLVTSVQFAGYGEPPLSIVSAKTDGSGVAMLPMGPTELGAINTSGSDPDGNEVNGVIGVTAGVWATFGPATPGAQGEPQLGGEGPLTPLSNFEITMEDGLENGLAGLFLSGPSVPTPFKCGTLLASPPAVPPLLFNLSPQGDVAIGGVWPDGIAADTELWFQIAIQDPDAICGVALSNGLQAITP